MEHPRPDNCCIFQHSTAGEKVHEQVERGQRSRDPVITAVCLCDPQHRMIEAKRANFHVAQKSRGINSPAGSQNLRSDAVCSSFSETSAAQEICFLAASLWRRVTNRAMDNDRKHGSCWFFLRTYAKPQCTFCHGEQAQNHVRSRSSLCIG
jgi:hypothetical protein